MYVRQVLCESKVLHRHVCIVFLPNLPIAILELPICLSYGWLTFLKRCYLLVRQEYNKHVTMKVDNYLYCNSNEFPNFLFY